MVQIHGSSAGNPDWDGPDLTLEVPRAMVGATYRAADALTRGHGSLVRFGSTGLFGSILLDTVTGAVVKLERDAHHVSIVNSSLPNFVVVVRAVIERFPFYDSGSDDSEWMAAARAVEEIVRGVDQVPSFGMDSGKRSLMILRWGIFLQKMSWGSGRILRWPLCRVAENRREVSSLAGPTIGPGFPEHFLNSDQSVPLISGSPPLGRPGRSGVGGVARRRPPGQLFTAAGRCAVTPGGRAGHR